MTLRTLHLYGDLADEFGAAHEVFADTVFDAIRIVGCNHPTFPPTVRKGNFHVAIGSADIDEAEEMHEHQLVVPRATGDFHLVPELAGGKSRGFKTIFSIVVGGALLATGIGGALGAFGAGATGLGVAGTTLSLSFATIGLMGAGIFLGGINQLLMPTPKGDTEDRKPTTFSFDGPGEVDDEGGPIPIIIGEVITGGVRIASSIESTGGASAVHADTNFFKGAYGGHSFKLNQMSAV